MTLSQAFINCFKSLGYDYNKIYEWSYAGGNYESLENYFLVLHNSIGFQRPKHKHKCICGNPIEKQAYIRKNLEGLVIGSCCIKKFIPTGMSRTCEKCKRIHQNRKDNLCNSCRNCVKKCIQCKEILTNDKFKMCFTCNSKIKKHHCLNCKQLCNEKYLFCWKCKASNPTIHHCVKCDKLCSVNYKFCWNCK